MARKLKAEAEKNHCMLKERQKITEEELAKSKVKLEKAQREVSSLDQRLGRAMDENATLRKKVGTQVCSRTETATKVVICCIKISKLYHIPTIDYQDFFPFRREYWQGERQSIKNGRKIQEY